VHQTTFGDNACIEALSTAVYGKNAQLVNGIGRDRNKGNNRSCGLESQQFRMRFTSKVRKFGLPTTVTTRSSLKRNTTVHYVSILQEFQNQVAP
jgi:hypothetical protein